MRKNLEHVEAFRNAGIDFVVIPVSSKEDKDSLLLQSAQALTKIIEEAESE